MSKKVSKPRARSYMPMRVLAEGQPRSRVKQEFASEVNINYIRSRMAKGILPFGYNPSTPMIFRDLTTDLSFMDAFDVVQKGREAFETLPIGLRRELDHDPRNLGTATREQFDRYGLLKKSDDKRSGTPDAKASDLHGGSGGDAPPQKTPQGVNSPVSPGLDGKK